MSRIGNKPISLSSGVTVTVDGKNVTVKGSKGELEHVVPELIELVVEDNRVVVSRANDGREARALHGLTRTLVANMVTGVNTGFTKELSIEGVGYRAKVSGRKLELNLGYSHPVSYTVPDGVDVSVTDNTKIAVTGTDKQKVGQVAATIRQFRKPEPYKGKGIRYATEHVRRKEGKTV